MNADPRRARHEALVCALEAAGLDALLVTSRANVRYLTGFSGSAAVAVATLADLLLVTDFRYDEQARAEAGAVARVEVDGASVWARLFRDLPTLGPLPSIGYEAQALSVKDAERLAQAGNAWRWSATSDLVERLRRHPLQRALRADKLTLAALEGTLVLALDPSSRDEVPVLRMLHEPVEAVRARAERLAALVGGDVEETVARVGGGALPLAELPSAACAVEEALAEPLRRGVPPVVALVRDGRTLLDCRTLTDAEVDEVAAAVRSARAVE